MDSLSAGQLVNLVLLALFLPAFSILLFRHATGRGTSNFVGGGRVAGTVAGLGTVLLVVGATLPVAESIRDTLIIAWGVFWLGSTVIHRYEARNINEPDAV